MNRTARIYFFLTVFIGALFFSPDSFSRSIKVMSFNILNQYFSDTQGHGSTWNVRKPLVLELINEVDPDIIGFQEDSPQQSLDLEQGLYGFQAVRFPVETIVPDKAHRAIFFKIREFILVDQGYFSQLNGGQRNTTWIKLKKIDSGTIFYVFNAHWNGFSNPTGLITHKLQAERLQEMISTITSGEPIIFTGDLNSINQTDPSIEYLTSTSGALLDFFYPAGFRKFNTSSTWRVCRTGFDDLLTSFTIDYVLTIDGIRFFSTKQVIKGSTDSSIFASDHPAVVHSLILPGENTNELPALLDLLLND